MALKKKLVLELAKGFRGRGKNCIKIARLRVEKALVHAFRGRKEKKQDARTTWISQINAGAREHGVRSSGVAAAAHAAHLDAARAWASMRPSAVVPN